MSDETSITATLERLAAAFNAHDIDAIMTFFAQDCSLDLPRGPDPHGRRYIGRDEVRRGLMTRFETTLEIATFLSFFRRAKSAVGTWSMIWTIWLMLTAL